jgi:hypothetical protein
LRSKKTVSVFHVTPQQEATFVKELNNNIKEGIVREVSFKDPENIYPVFMVDKRGPKSTGW